MLNQYTEQPSSLSLDDIPPQFIGLGIGGFFLFLFLILWVRSGLGGKSGQLGRARWEEGSEQKRSSQTIIQGIQSGQDVGTWLGDPDGLYIDPETGAIILPYDQKTIYLGRITEHIAFLAGTGGGKSYSLSDPIGLSFIRRGWPLIVLDVKGHEEQYHRDDIPDGMAFTGSYGDKVAPSSKLAGCALRRGYEVFTVAPGFLDSDRLNPLTFMRDSSDATTAFVLAKVIRDNLMAGKSEGDHDFFDQSANLLIQALFMYVKRLERANDLVMAHQILNLPHLTQALSHAKLPPYIKAQFAQFLRTQKAQETADSIAGTAAIAYARFVTPELTAVFCKDSNIPIKLGRKQMVIYRMNIKDMHAIAPLMGALMSLHQDNNLFVSREEPILFHYDELARIKLNELRDRMDIARSNLGCFLVGAQGFDSFDEKWGKGAGELIVGGAKTEIIGQIKGRTAKYYSTERLGKMDIRVRNKGKSRSRKSGSSHSDNEQLNAVELMQQSEFSQIPRGQFIIMNPAHTDKKGRESIPFIADIHIPQSQIDEMAAGEQTWREYRRWKIRNNTTRPMSEQGLRNREMYAHQLFPDPEIAKKKQEKKTEKETAPAYVKALF